MSRDTKTLLHRARFILIILLIGCLVNLEAGVAQTLDHKVYLPLITRSIDGDTLLLLHFDESAGTTLFQDSSPYKHHALCHSPACPTKAERGLDFNGQDSYIMSSASIQGLSSFTLAGWYYARSYEHAGKHPVVFFAPGVDCARAALRIGGGYTEGPVLFVADTDGCVP